MKANLLATLSPPMLLRFDNAAAACKESSAIRKACEMGAWGVGAFENDAAMDWLGLYEGLGALAVMTPSSAIFELVERGRDIPPENEQKFWAACEVAAAANGGSIGHLPENIRNVIPAHFTKILMIPNVMTRIGRALELVIAQETELAELWRESEEAEEFYKMRENIRLGIS